MLGQEGRGARGLGRGGGGWCTLQAGGEAIMQGVQLQLAGAQGFTESLLPTCGTGQAHIAPHLRQLLIKAPLHLIHTCIGGLKLVLQLGIQLSS